MFSPKNENLKMKKLLCYGLIREHLDLLKSIINNQPKDRPFNF